MIRLTHALLALRVTVASIFIAHAITRIVNGTVDQFAGFLESKGLPQGHLLVWAITAFEIGGGALLLLGKFQRQLAIGFIGMLLAGIVIIHAKLGWWVGEHGTGGMEYSVALIAALLVIGARDSAR